MPSRCKLKRPFEGHLASFWLWLAFCLPTTSLAAELSWQEGWNLIVLPGATPASTFPDDVQIWELRDDAYPDRADAPEASGSTLGHAFDERPMLRGEVRSWAQSQDGEPRVVWLYATGTGTVSLAAPEIRPMAPTAGLGSGWTVLDAQAFLPDGPPDGWRVERWDAVDQNYRALGSEAYARPFVAYVRPAAQVGISGHQAHLAPKPPTNLWATGRQQTLSLSWQAPHQWSNGARILPGTKLQYAVYLDGALVKDGIETTHFEYQVPHASARHEVHLKTSALSEVGPVLRSRPSKTVSVWMGTPPLASKPGVFEVPNAVRGSVGDIAQPKVVVTESRHGRVTYLLYLVRGRQGEGDRIQVQRSLSFGAPGPKGWSTNPILVTDSGPEARILEFSVAGHQSNLDIVWIEGPREAKPGGSNASRILLQRNCSPQDFRPCPEKRRVLREGTPYKRALSTAYDYTGNHHLIWSEANKVYYLKNFAGGADGDSLVNVFDEHRRKATTGVVKTLVRYDEVDGRCPCADCWCEDRYPVAEERDPKKGGAPRGPFTDRRLETYVYTPALFVGRETVSVVARQTQFWDPEPVPNPTWARMFDTPIYSETVWPLRRPTRYVLGWRKSWKTAYEPGDEALYDTLGTQYQYRYDGTWYKEDAIKVAKRPLHDGELPEPDGTKAFSPWRVSVVDDTFPAAQSQPASYPALVTTPSGTMVVAYEKGPSMDPNASDGHAIVARTSKDGGQTWFGSDTPLAYGYRPQIQVLEGPDSNPEQIAVLYYAPLRQESGSSDHVLGTIRIARALGPNSLVEFQDERLNERAGEVEPAKSLHHHRSGVQADHQDGWPSWTTYKDLILVTWVREASGANGHNRVVTTRASQTQEPHRISASFAKTLTGGTSVPVTFQTLNEYSMRVAPTEREVEFGRDLIEHHSLDLSQGLAVASVPVEKIPHLEERLKEAPIAARALVSIAPESDSEVSSVGHPERFQLAPAPEMAMDLRVSSHADSIFSAGPAGNVKKALALRASLRKPQDLDRTVWVQAEYRPSHARGRPDERQEALLGGQQDAHAEEAGPTPHEKDAEDSVVLAGFSRSWVYTQGIALAQSVRRHEHEYARGFARWLCQPEHAVWQDERMLGWHFSRNTDTDTWKDPRLVTGANAWALHGLGTFVVSEAFWGLSADEQAHIRRCYQGALRGLEDHRVVMDLEARERQADASECSEKSCAYLMTAGWTTQGLQHASAPWVLGLTEDKHEQWAYYDLLDALGYEDFSEDTPPPIRRSWSIARGATKEETFFLAPVAFEPLSLRTRATNVVTEHNLDVLSVLNHALSHVEVIWSRESKPEQERVERRLRAWRDGVQRGIFELLWEAPQDVPVMEKKAPNGCRLEPKPIVMTGRVITGGEFASDGHFSPNRDVAVDNCSWLALSVDYRTLPPRRVEQLRTCLEYSVEKFADHMPYGANHACYYGSHYFPNSFRDRYIARSDQQERSYHLEATLGLILGLHRFFQAYPQQAGSLEAKARALWVGVQAFVRDHGFVYSSQRIQDLSTRLASSTAVIWYLDVFDALERQDGDLNQPLKNYADEVDAQALERSLARSWTRLKTFRPEAGQGAWSELKDPALAVLAAVNLDDLEVATAWVQGLLHAFDNMSDQSGPSTGPSALGFAALEGPLFAAYALTRFYARHPARVAGGLGSANPLLSEVSEVLAQVLLALKHQHYKETTDGAWLVTTDERAEELPAAVALQVLFYFVLLEAEDIGILKDGPFRAEALARALQSAFWDHKKRRPLRVRSGGDEGAARILDASLYSLFASHIGDVPKATFSLDVLEEGLPPGTWAGLALRRAGRLDPRLEEIALVEAQKSLALDAPKDSAGVELATAFDAERLLTHNPRGLFGVDVGPSVMGHAAFDHRQVAAHERASLVAQLEEAYVEDLAALFASDTQPYFFDASLTHMTHLRFIERMLEEDVPLRRWPNELEPQRDERAGVLFSDRIQETIAELRLLCEDDAVLAERRATIVRYLGLACADVVRFFESLLVRRVGTVDADFGPTIFSAEGHPSSPYTLALTRITDGFLQGAPESTVRYEQGGALFGNRRTAGFLSNAASTRSAFVLDERLLVAPKGPFAVTEVQEALQERFKDAVLEEAGLAFGQAPQPPAVYYAFSGLDLVGARHAESWVYWQRPSIEYRLFDDAQTSGFGDASFSYIFEGKVSTGPVLATQAAGLTRQRTFRQFVNRYAGGSLKRVADDAGVPLLTLHRSLRRGLMSNGTFELLASTYLDSKTSVEKWRARLSPSPAENQEWASAGVTDVSLEGLLGGLLGADGWLWPFQAIYADGDALLGPRPEAVAHLNLALGLEMAKQVGFKEAFRWALLEIAGTGAFIGISGAVHEEEIEDLVERLFAEERHNVIIVDQDVVFDVPEGYDYVGSDSHLPEVAPKDLYRWPREAISRHPAKWQEVVSLALIDTLGFGVGPDSREEAAEALRAFVQENAPQNVILKKTWDGVEIYQKLGFDPALEAPRGVVMHLTTESSEPLLIHRQPGPWSQWYEENVLGGDVPIVFKDAYIRAVNAWILESLLARPGRLSFSERRELIANQIIGSSPKPHHDGAGEPPKGGAAGPGDHSYPWRGESVIWVDGPPRLIPDGPWDLLFSPTDGIVRDAYPDALLETESARQELKKSGVKRYLGAQTMTQSSQYPSGVSEMPIQDILRSLPISVFTPRLGATSLADALKALVKDGFNLRHPLRVYRLPSGRVAVHPEDHVWLAAMNLVKETKIPVRFGWPPFEWAEENKRMLSSVVYGRENQQQPTPQSLQSARHAIYHATLVKSTESQDQVFSKSGLTAVGTDPDIWTLLYGRGHSGWIWSTKNVGTTRQTTFGYDTTIYVVRPETGVDVNTAVRMDVGDHGVVLQHVHPKNVLGSFTQAEPHRGRFEVNVSADSPLPDAFNLATMMDQVDLWSVPLSDVSQTAVVAKAESLKATPAFTPPLLIIRKSDGGLQVLSSHVDVHALRYLGVDNAPAAVIDWKALAPADKETLIQNYGVSQDGSVGLGMTSVEPDLASASLFYPTDLPKQRTFSQPHGSREVAVAVLDDLGTGQDNIVKVKNNASDGLRHAAVVRAEIERQSRITGIDDGPIGQVVGYDLGPADETTPNDVAAAIRAVIAEHQNNDDGMRIVAISLSPKLTYSLQSHHSGADAQTLNTLKTTLQDKLAEVIAEAGRAGIMIFAGGAPGASLSQSIVEAGQGQAHFFHVGGTNSMTTEPFAPAASSNQPFDFAAPGLVPLSTESHIRVESSPFVPIALSAANALVADIKTGQFFEDVDDQTILAMVREAIVPHPIDAKQPRQLSLERLYKLSYELAAAEPTIEHAKRSMDKKRGFVHPPIGSVEVTEAMILHKGTTPSLAPVASLTGVKLKEGDELILFGQKGRLEDIVHSSIWNGGIQNGHIQIQGTAPTVVSYFGGSSLRSAGQWFRVPDLDARVSNPTGSEDERALSTDAIVTKDYDAIIAARDSVLPSLGNTGVKRLVDGQEVTSSHYPKGVADVPIKEVYRSRTVGIDEPSARGGETITSLLSTLATRGVDVKNPVHVSVRHDERGKPILIAWEDDHDLLAALNLLGQEKIPVRLLPRPDDWTASVDNRLPVAESTSPYGVSESVVEEAQAGIQEAVFVVGPDDPKVGFRTGLSADGNDLNLWNHLWNGGLQSAWLTGYSLLRLGELLNDPQYRGRKVTLYLVRARGSVPVHSLGEFVTSQVALPSISPRDVLAAVEVDHTDHPQKFAEDQSWVVNTEATDPLPTEISQASRVIILDPSKLKFDDFDVNEASRITETIVEEHRGFNPPVLVNSDHGAPKFLAGKETALALRNIGAKSLYAFEINWLKLDASQQSDFIKKYPVLEGTPLGDATPQEGKILRALRFKNDHTIGNKISIIFDEVLSASGPDEHSFTDVAIYSVNHGETIHEAMKNKRFFGDFTSLAQALSTKRKLFSINNVLVAERFLPVDLSNMMDVGDGYGEGAFPRPPAGWAREIGYWPFKEHSRGHFRISNTTTFRPRTVSIPIKLGKPRLNSVGKWLGFDVNMSFYDELLTPRMVEIYFAKIDPTQSDPRPLDFIYTRLPAALGGQAATYDFLLRNVYSSAAENLAPSEFFRRIMHSNTFELWTSARIIGEASTSAYVGTIEEIGPSRESQPVKVNVREWANP